MTERGMATELCPARQSIMRTRSGSTIAGGALPQLVSLRIGGDTDPELTFPRQAYVESDW